MTPEKEKRAVFEDWKTKAALMVRTLLESNKQFQSLPEETKLAEFRKMDIAITTAAGIAVLGYDHKITAKVEIVLDLMDPLKS